MISETMKNKDVLVGLTEVELRNQILDAIAPLVGLIRASESFKASFIAEVVGAIDEGGNAGENLVDNLYADMLTMESEKSLETMSDAIDKLIHNSRYQICRILKYLDHTRALDALI